MLLYPEVGLCSNEVPERARDKYDADASKYWDTFYRRNADKFYKDRHYFDREFPELLNGRFVLLEVGCGAGNSVFPLLELNPEIQVFACDFSPRAVQIVQAHPQYASGRAKAFVADITQDDLCAHVPAGSVDFVTMVFVLSAISPAKMQLALANIARVLRPGSGRVLFRDYGRGDLAQDKHQSSGVKRLAENFFVRGDGTCCFYFSEPELEQLFAAQGFRCLDMRMHERDVENHKRQITMHRRWVQAVFQLQAASRPAAVGHAPPAPQPHQHQAFDHQAAGEDCTPVAGSWLVGAAGRLASGLSAPGVPSGRAQLPLSLESADELAMALHPCGTAMSASRMEEELDRDFFDTIARDAEDVVEEELAAASNRIAAIRLVEPLEAAAMYGQTAGATTTAAAAAAAAGTRLAREAWAQGNQVQHDTQQPHQAAAAAGAMCWAPAAGCPAASCSSQAEEVCVAPGLSFLCSVPPEARGKLQVELALARLLAACPPLVAQRSVVQLDAGTSGVVAMTAVRGATRVVSTHGSCTRLQLLARNLHLNSARLVVERLRTCQLAGRNPSHVQQVLRQAPEPPGCFELVLAAGLVEQCLEHVECGAVGQDGLEAGSSDLADALCAARVIVQVQRSSRRLASVRDTGAPAAGSMQGVEQECSVGPPATTPGALAMFVERSGVLARAEQRLGLLQAAAAAGWTVQRSNLLPQVAGWTSSCFGQFEALFLSPSPASKE